MDNTRDEAIRSGTDPAQKRTPVHESPARQTVGERDKNPNVDVEDGRDTLDRTADQRANVANRDKSDVTDEHRDAALSKDAGSRPMGETERRNQVKIKLLRDIMIDGEHEEIGSIFSVSRPLAARLVGEGSAEYDEPHTAPTSVNRMEQAKHDDPSPQRVSGPVAKVKKDAK